MHKVLLTRFWLPAYFFILISGLAWIKISASQELDTTNGNLPLPRPGYLAPEIQLNSNQGALVSLSDLRGKVVIVNFWASWCPPCRAEMPALETVHQDYSERDLVILAVNATEQDNIEAVEAFAQELNLSFTILFDDTGNINRLYQVTALPTTYFIDANGIIKDVVIGGPMSETLLRARAEELLGD